jgi:hypothetical protein
MRKLLVGLAAIMTTGVLLTVPAGASAATFGSNLSDPVANTLNCSAFPDGCTTSFGLTLPPGSVATNGLTAPFSGVIVRWRLKTGTGVPPTKLRVLRPGNSTTRGAIATSATVTPEPSTTNTFDTQLPVQAGDAIGIDSQFPPFATVAGPEIRYIGGTLVDGGAPAASTGFANSVLLLNADVEADVDGDGYGDETQDLCKAEPAEHLGCVLTIQVEPGGRVTAPGIDCPGDCTEAYPQGTLVPLHAVADPGFEISTRTDLGGCSGGSREDCTMAMFGNKSASYAFFDNKSPETTITKGPKKRSSKRKVKIKFTSSEPPGKFQCSLDKAKFKPCESPYIRTLKPGKHTFQVSAIDTTHNPDFSPAKLRFRIEE